MKSNRKKRVSKVILWLALGFVTLFLFRLTYGYVTVKGVNSNTNQTQYSGNTSFDNLTSGRNNYASKKYKGKGSNSGGTSIAPTAVKVDQKYEKIADVKTFSKNFNEEEKQARNEIKAHEALIQYEQKSGNDGSQRLSLVIGVPPDNFDLLYEKLIAIGKVESKLITKKDKTNEYRELNAKKITLENRRKNLVDLKSKGGKIEEYIELENKILEVDQQLQELGVNLGDFDGENEFCTVKFSMNETKALAITKIGLLHRVKVALEWTIKMYLPLIAILFFIVLGAWVLISIIDKLKIIDKLVKDNRSE